MLLDEAERLHCTETDPEKTMKGAVLLLDQEKAYNWVEWPFLHAALQQYGLSGSWLNVILDYYSKPSLGWFLVNGFKSKRVDITRGLQQGNPLSPILYNMAFEAFLATVRVRINGIRCHGICFKVQALADNTLPFVDSPSDLAILEEIIDHFGMASGSKLNDQKCVLIPLYGDRQNWTDRFPTLGTGDITRYLGALFSRTGISISDQQQKLTDSLKERLDGWKDRNLSTKGRVLALNTLLLSKIWFSVAFTAYSNPFLDWVEKAISDFIWEYRKQPWVNLQDMSLPREKGGLGLMPLRAQIDGLHLRWWKELWDPKNTTKWAVLTRQLLEVRIN